MVGIGPEPGVAVPNVLAVGAVKTGFRGNGVAVTAGGVFIGGVMVEGDVVGLRRAFWVSCASTVWAAAVNTASGLTCSVALADGRVQAASAKIKASIKVVAR